MVPFRDFVGVNIAPVSKKTAVKCLPETSKSKNVLHKNPIIASYVTRNYRLCYLLSEESSRTRDTEAVLILEKSLVPEQNK